MPTTRDPIPAPVPAPHPGRRLRIIGVIVLVFGIASAGLVYWVGTRTADVMDDPAMAGFDRQQRHQMEVLYGQMGRLMEDLTDDLKRPGVQAGIIVGMSVVIALGCFHFARPLEPEDEEAR